MSRRNPLMTPVEVQSPEPPDITDQLLGEAVALTGPQQPLLVGTLPEGVAAWPRVEVTDHRLVTVAGLHGGAGASTVAQLFGEDAVDAGQGWPIAAGWARPLPRLNVVVVARTHSTGLQAAEQFAGQWAAGELSESRLLGLVLVDDAPKLLDAQSRQVKRLLKLTPRGARIPWNEQWRLSAPDTDSLPRRIRKIIHGYRGMTQTPAQTPAQTQAQAETPQQEREA